MASSLKPLITLSSIVTLLFCVMMCQTPEQRVSGAQTVEIGGLVDHQSDSVPAYGNSDSSQHSFDLQYLTGHFDPAQHADFVLIDSVYADRAGLYLHRATYAAFVEMYQAALQDGIQLQIRSATRNFNSQKSIWERKWSGETTIENGKNAVVAYPDPVQRATMILKYSSMPGTSRHHWGTDIDLNAFENSWFDSGPGLDIYNWLSQHAAAYGFCQPYSAKGDARLYGYEEERWHWSYMPLSQILTSMAADSLRDEMISGFQGAQVAPQLRIVERYVLGIHPACLLR